MLRALIKLFALSGCIVSLSVSMTAQQVVHALTGTVSSINKASQTIAALQDGGGDSVFQSPSGSKTRVAFDKQR